MTDLPVTHVVNTHYHADHAGGNVAFSGAEIIATDETARFLHERDGERVEYARTFGLEFQELPAVAPPTRTFRGALSLDLGGETIELFQAGRVETPDACAVWWPSRKVLLSGDGVATTGYPYLGVPFLDEGLQDDGEWTGYLRHLRGLQAEYLLAGHGTALIGKDRIAARLDLLVALFTDLFAATKAEMQAGTPFAELVGKVDARLSRYASHPDLAQTAVSQRFAIYRAYNSAHPGRRGQGWWHDLRPSVIRRAPRAEAEAARAGLARGDLPARVAALVKAGRGPLAHALLERWIEHAPGDAGARGLLADLLFDAAAGVTPVVDATEYIAAATAAAKAALAIDPAEPLALLTLGCVEVWSAMVLAQSMDRGIEKLAAALGGGGLVATMEERKAAFFLGKAHQYELRDDESDQWLRRVLPAWLRFAYPLFRKKLRATP